MSWSWERGFDLEWKVFFITLMLFRRQRLFFEIVFFDREETPQQVKVHRRWLRDARNGLEFFSGGGAVSRN